MNTAQNSKQPRYRHVKERLHTATKARDGVKAGREVDILREMGFNYAAVFEIAREADSSLDYAEWDAMMEEADRGG